MEYAANFLCRIVTNFCVLSTILSALEACHHFTAFGWLLFLFCFVFLMIVLILLFYTSSAAAPGSLPNCRSHHIVPKITFTYPFTSLNHSSVDHISGYLQQTFLLFFFPLPPSSCFVFFFYTFIWARSTGILSFSLWLSMTSIQIVAVLTKLLWLLENPSNSDWLPQQLFLSF